MAAYHRSQVKSLNIYSISPVTYASIPQDIDFSRGKNTIFSNPLRNSQKLCRNLYVQSNSRRHCYTPARSHSRSQPCKN